MARPLRLEFAGALYHVTSRGDGQEDIHRCNDDRRDFLAVLGAAGGRFNWLMHAYCLMTNHYHLLVETPDANLSRGMRQLNGAAPEWLQTAWLLSAFADSLQPVRFRQLNTQSKHLVDTIKMIAYRAETAMATSLREHLKRPDEARRLLRALYTTEADLSPDPDTGTLTVRLHHGANAATDQVIRKLCEEFNETETVFPRTNLRLVMKLGST